MRVEVTLAVLLSVSCAKSPAPVPRAPSPEPARDDEPVTTAKEPTGAPEREGCLPVTSAKAGVAHVELQGRRALACYSSEEGSTRAGEGYPCLRVDIDAKRALGAVTWTAEERSPEPERSAPFELSTTRDQIEVCASAVKTCSTIKVRHKPAAGGHGEANDDDSLVAAVNEDGSRVFVFASELRAAKNPGLGRATFGDVYDVKTGKRLARVDLARALGETAFSDSSNVWRARFVDANVLVEDYSCCGPGGATALVDPERQRGRLLHGYDGEIGRVSGSVYFARDGKKLSLLDFGTLTELATFEAPGAPIGDPERAEALVALDDKTLVLAYASPPGLMLIDLVKKTAGTLPLPLCE